LLASGRSMTKRAGSGSGSGSGSFYHQTKIVWQSLIPTAFWILFDFLSFKNNVNNLQKVISRKTFFSKLVFCWHLEGQWRKQQDPDPDPDPDPLVRGMDPQHCLKHCFSLRVWSTCNNNFLKHYFYVRVG
jgi:hypothetical protein